MCAVLHWSVLTADVVDRWQWIAREMIRRRDGLNVALIMQASTDLQTKAVRSANANASRAEEKSIACLGGFPVPPDFVIACISHLLFSRCSFVRPGNQCRRLASAGQRRQHCDARSLGARVKWFVLGSARTACMYSVGAKSVVGMERRPPETNHRRTDDIRPSGKCAESHPLSSRDSVTYMLPSLSISHYARFLSRSRHYQYVNHSSC